MVIECSPNLERIKAEAISAQVNVTDRVHTYAILCYLNTHNDVHIQFET